MNNCIICNTETITIHQNSFNVDYHRCPNCDFIYKNPDNFISTEEEKEIYDTHENSYEDERYLEYFQRFLDFTLFPYIKKTAKGLDYGSGPEPVLSMLLERKYNVSMDIYDLYFYDHPIDESKKYDFITCTEVIEHIANPIEILTYFKQHLNDNGILAIMTQFHRNDDEFFMNWHYMRDMSHISFFTPKTFKVLADMLGFDILACDDHKCITLQRCAE